MTLDQALRILAMVHTRYNSDVGFTVEMGAMPDFEAVNHMDYADAWMAVRMHLYLDINPAPQPAAQS